jgi:hypothetical protein
MIIGISGQAGAGKDTIADIMKEHTFAKVSLADPLKRIARDVFDFTDEQLWGPSEMRNKPDKRYPREHSYPSPAAALLSGKMTCACCGFTYDNRTTPYAGEPQCYLTPRYALQLLGTEWGRKCYGNVWVDYALRTADNLLTQGYSYSQQRGLILVKGRSVGITTMASTHNGVVIPDCRFRNEIDAVHAAGGKLIRVKRDAAGLQGAAAQHASEKEQQSIPDSDFDYIIDNNESLEKLPQKVHLALEMLLAES